MSLKMCCLIFVCGDFFELANYFLNFSFLFFVVGPIYRDGKRNESQLLAKCVLNSLEKAKSLGLESISIPGWFF